MDQFHGRALRGETGYSHNPATGEPASEGHLWVKVDPDADPDYEWSKPYGGYLEEMDWLVGRPDLREEMIRDIERGFEAGADDDEEDAR